MNSKVSYHDPTFAAVVYDYFGREYRFRCLSGEWFVEERFYSHADFYRS